MADPFVIVRIVPSERRTGVVRAFAVTPYDLELLASELRRCGPGARLEVAVGGDDEAQARVSAALAPIAERGVELVVSLVAPRADGLLGFLDDVAHGRRSSRARPAASARGEPPGGDGGNGGARVREEPVGRVAPYSPRASDVRRDRGARGTRGRATSKEDAHVPSTPCGR